jgi:hypothetical protein
VIAPPVALDHEIQDYWRQCRFGPERNGTFYQSDRYHQTLRIQRDR